MPSVQVKGKMRDAHWKLETLPPGLRQQAERQLGVAAPPPLTKETIARIASEFGGKIPWRGDSKIKGGMFKASRANATPKDGEVLPNPAVQAIKRPELHKFDKAPRARKTLTPDMASSLVSFHEVSPDGTEVRFILDVSPYAIPTFQQKKIAVIGGHPRLFKQAKVKKAEQTITKAMSPYSHLFSSWGDAPRCVSIDFLYEYPTSTPKRDLVDYRYSIYKADLDNSEKGLSDALTEAGFWKDDALIAELHLRKFRTITKPRIILTIKKLKSTLNSYETDLFGDETESFFPSEHETSSGKDL